MLEPRDERVVGSPVIVYTLPSEREKGEEGLDGFDGLIILSILKCFSENVRECAEEDSGGP